MQGSKRVFEAAAAAGVRRARARVVDRRLLARAIDRRSTSPGPREGIPSSFYSRHKAACERELDVLEARHPELRVVRLRPGLIFKREAATEIRRLFAGPLLPSPLCGPACCRAPAARPASPSRRCTPTTSARPTGSRSSPTTPRARTTSPPNRCSTPPSSAGCSARGPCASTRRAVRALTTASWRARLQPTPPGWLDMGLRTPIMDVSRARDELGWAPRHAPARRCSSCSTGCARARGLRPRRSTRPRGAAAGARVPDGRRAPNRLVAASRGCPWGRAW